MKTKEAVQSLVALGQESRLAIFRYLVKAGPEGAFAGRIAEALDIPPALISFHVKGLCQAGLVDSDRDQSDGRLICYTANFVAMNSLIAYLTENCCGGDPAACCPPAPPARRRKSI
ncbi:helix-turn-helix domain-containing protein [Rudaea sp.]|uniref:ArsR/SmtB family transcription factor n=1 Tax=Rudaea sp. TaxID=2136325 RepID=UPI00322045B9